MKEQEARKIHRKAMRLSQRAFVINIEGSQEEAKELYLECFELEKQAVSLLKDATNSQPTRARLFRSAAYVALKIDNFEEARDLAVEGMNHNPPKWEVEEFLKILRIVFEHLPEEKEESFEELEEENTSEEEVEDKKNISSENLNRIEAYIQDFLGTRYEEYEDFYQDEFKNRKEAGGIYALKNGEKLLNFLRTIKENAKTILAEEKLVPNIYVNADVLWKALKSCQKYIENHQDFIEENQENNPYIIDKFQEIMEGLLGGLEEVLNMFEAENVPVPVYDLRHALIMKNIDKFIKILKSALASVSYPIQKVSEGFIHSNIHLILKLLGFDITSEENTNIGRIDAVVRLPKTTYIFEFKLGTAEEAIQQIKDKQYYQKYELENKEIMIVGVGFSAEKRNIEDYRAEEIKL